MGHCTRVGLRQSQTSAITIWFSNREIRSVLHCLQHRQECPLPLIANPIPGIAWSQEWAQGLRLLLNSYGAQDHLYQRE